MQASSAILLDQQAFSVWAWITLGSTALAAAQPGQFVALRCAMPRSYDPLLRQPLFVARSDPSAGTLNLLVAQSDPAYAFLTQQARGTQLDLLGPLGKGWNVPASVRSIALIGVAAQAAPLFALAHHAVARGAAVSLIIGARDRSDAPPPSLLPAAAEYNIAPSYAEASAAIALLDDQLLRWADLLAIALPQAHWSTIARRVDQVRIRWSREFAQVAIAPSFACHIGVCGVCGLETRHGQRLGCVKGPVFDLRELAR